MNGEPEKPKLRLVVDNTAEGVSEEARAGERVIGSGHDDFFPATDQLPDAEREKKSAEAAARALTSMIAKVTESYNPQHHRDANAGKLGYGLLFVAQAGLARQEIDDFLEDYTSPADENDPASIQKSMEESARLTDSLITMQELFETLVNTEGKVEPAKLKQFRKDWENSAVWDDEARQKTLLDAIQKAYVVCKHKADQMALSPEAWLHFCADTITTDGMRMAVPNSLDPDVLDDFDDKREVKFNEAWNKWMRKPTLREMKR